MKACCTHADDDQRRNMPSELHRRLKERAGRTGMSLSDYLLSQIKEDGRSANFGRDAGPAASARCHFYTHTRPLGTCGTRVALIVLDDSAGFDWFASKPRRTTHREVF
jgi:hypothetical protein